MKNAPLLSSLFACFSDAVVTRPCDVIAGNQFMRYECYCCDGPCVLYRYNISFSGNPRTKVN